MKIYFIRHGHSEHNAAYERHKTKTVYRSHEYRYSTLTEKGIQQAKSVQLPESVQRVYCSPLKRCIETARHIFGNEETLFLHDGLVETQGPYPCNWRDSYEPYLDGYNTAHLEKEYVPTKIRETDEETKERAIQCLESIRKETSNLNAIAVVTHNDWLESLFNRPFLNCEVYCVDA